MEGRALDGRPFLAWHLSGGTSELLLVGGPGEGGRGAPFPSIRAVGGSRDISFGQLLDRVGNAMGLAFPAGREIDAIAASAGEGSGGGGMLTRISADGTHCSLSGAETQALRLLPRLDGPQRALLARELMDRIGDCIHKMTAAAAELCGVGEVLFTGGVAASSCLRGRPWPRGVKAVFGSAALSGDNAVGTALLGACSLCRRENP